MTSGPELPSGTVTFLFTDIEGSTRLLKQLRDGYARVLVEHQELLRVAFAEHGGQVVDTQGDSFFVVFRRAKDAVSAAVAAQRALAGHEWSEGVEVRVRMGIHTGQAEASGGRYHGLAVHRASRIGDSAHGGQVLVSQTTRDLLDDEEEESAGIELRDLGEQRLKDLDRPVRLYQLVVEGLPSQSPRLRVAPSKPDEEHAVAAAPRGWRRLRLIAPLAVVLIGGVVVAGVLLTRGTSESAQASAGVAADSVGVFDARSGKPIAQAPVRPGPSAVAVGDGSIWVANVDDDSVSRIDPRTNALTDTIPVGKGPAALAVGNRFVWVANGLDGTVSKIDPSTDGVVDRIQVGNGPTGVAFGEGAVWVANSTDRTVTPIDPHTGIPREPIPVDAGADGIAVGAGAVWVTSESAGSVSRIDPLARRVIETINVGRGARAVAVGSGAIWVANSLAGTVSRVDPVSDDERTAIGVGDGPSGVAVTADGKSVWVSSEIPGRLSRIDTAQDKVVQTVTTGNRPQDIAMTGNTMYVTVRTSGLAHRGGTLTILGVDRFDSVDLAAAYQTNSWSALILTNDGLVTFKRVGGSSGTRLVPDLATFVPTATDGGRTYTFRVRRGIRYSNGTPLQPADFRRGIERALATPGGYASLFLSGIVGSETCVKTPKRCDLSRGIVADRASNTVTFHLTDPDPDFLVKLAFPAAYAVPASTPLKAKLPLPATGPYMIVSYDPRHGVRLARNPRFHEWYGAAQPDGYPGTIVWRFDVAPEAQRRAVGRGTADLASDAGFVGKGIFAPPGFLAAMRTRYASQLHVNPLLDVFFVFLNTRVPPFDDVRVRQAVNYAVDRNRIVDLHGGLELNQPTCQVLPPNLDGYRRYCPFTINPTGDGRYTGPDLAKARGLVAASGTKGQEVTVSGIAGIFQPHGGDYFVSVLRSLGYKARFKNYKDANTYFAAAADSRTRMQAGINVWGHDYPAPGDFFPLLLTCRSFVPRSISNLNFAEFCDPRIDAEIARAQSLQITDPGAASRLWSKIDRDVVKQAPWFFLQNPLQLDFVSRRVGNYQYNPQWGVLLDQLWVK